MSSDAGPDLDLHCLAKTPNSPPLHPSVDARASSRELRCAGGRRQRARVQGCAHPSVRSQGDPDREAARPVGGNRAAVDQLAVDLPSADAPAPGNVTARRAASLNSAALPPALDGDGPSHRACGCERQPGLRARVRDAEGLARQKQRGVRIGAQAVAGRTEESPLGRGAVGKEVPHRAGRARGSPLGGSDLLGNRASIETEQGTVRGGCRRSELQCTSGHDDRAARRTATRHDTVNATRGETDAASPSHSGAYR
jgi:hypothetical protein